VKPSKDVQEGLIENSVSISPSSTESQHVYHFRNHLLVLICFSRHGMNDPFLEHILPLTVYSPLVRSSVETAAAAHLSILRADSSIEPIQLQGKTLRLLRERLSQEDNTLTHGEELAAASLLLVYYEVCLRGPEKGQSNLTEIRLYLESQQKRLDVISKVLTQSLTSWPDGHQNHHPFRSSLRYSCTSTS
jgi:hypothetical protein